VNWQAEGLNIEPRNSRTDCVGFVSTMACVVRMCCVGSIDHPTATSSRDTCAVGLYPLLSKS